MKAIAHPYAPAHMTRTSRGNVAACCDRPADEHPAFVDGTTVTVVLTRQLRGLRGGIAPKGARFQATRSYRADALQEVRPSRWFTNERGNLEEERGEYEMVVSPGWTIVLDGYNTGIPWRFAKEVG